MKNKTGLWIDHRRAVVVKVSGADCRTTHIDSNAERDQHPVAVAHAEPALEKHLGVSEDTRQRHFEGQLGKYYDEVIATLGDAEDILIFGPGEAKGELKARLEHIGHGARIARVETADKMSDSKIVAKVREHRGA